jgi:SAM-dependent methyltransferase
VTAAQFWADELAAWAIPPEILAAAPESPYGFPPELFGGREAGPDLLARAAEALPAGGSVLDVGVGGGAASLPLAGAAGRVTGVDSSAEMLTAFSAAAADRGVPYDTVPGRWPDVADSVGPADVVVCAHVFYNVADLPDFARALAGHARRRVVVELTGTHPWVPLAPLWRHFHGGERPAGPDADLAVAVLREVGLPVRSTRRPRPRRWRPEDRPAVVAFTRRRLCLPPEREPEVDRLVGDPDELMAGDLVTLWWDRGR